MAKRYDARTLRYVAKRLRTVQSAYAKDLATIAENPTYRAGIAAGIVGFARIAAAEFEAEAKAIAAKEPAK